jgi:hypothetical protein
MILVLVIFGLSGNHVAGCGSGKEEASVYLYPQLSFSEGEREGGHIGCTHDAFVGKRERDRQPTHPSP